MKIVFLSNYFNHHQKPLSDALFSMCEEYFFIATGKMSKEREALGYEKLNAPYVLDISNRKDGTQAKRLIDEADVVITGSAPEYLLEGRKKEKKLIFRYSERPVKKRREFIKYFPRLIKWNLQNPRRLPIYLLSASAYAPYEYAKFFLFGKRAFKWGYFPEVKKYPGGAGELLSQKKPNSILWVARLIELKHPELAVFVAEKLKNEGYSFTLDIVGDGPLKAKLENLISDKRLNDTVFLRGAMSSNKVRSVMEKSEIFLFTSDRNEGWGAVLNEAMNSACAVVAGHEIGSVPFLINDGKNGIIYRDADMGDLYKKTKALLNDKQLCRYLGINAYDTMVNEWSPNIAATRIVDLSEHIIHNQDCTNLYRSGPCSKAKIIGDGWFSK